MKEKERGTDPSEVYKLQFFFRYYYNTKILLPVSGRRLVYKFGPQARGWSAQEPIFSPSYESDDSDEEDSGEASMPFSLLPSELGFPQLSV